ncbi:glycosyltransferase [Micromonospora sp. WMMD723]|uniref:glycosyltransferase n=1 Tax=unclassified Micromonospora TaxID=2617518 RepID=UPI003B952DB6
MIELVTRPVRWAIRRGYQPAEGDPPPTGCLVVRPGPTVVRSGIPVRDVAATLGDGFAGGLALVLPTYVGRAPLSSHRESVEELVSQLTDLPPTVAARPLVLVVGMQYRDGQHDEAVERLRRLSEVAASPGGPTFVGIAMPQAGKSRMLNAAFAMATGLGLAGVAWVDDDVTFSTGCIGRLFEDFLDRGARGSVGASKVPQPNPYAAARLLHRGKGITKTPKFSYPHGCCMVVDADLAARGIPDRYTCEDDYFCFALLDPRDENPLHRTHIVADAVSYHLTGGPAGEIRQRVNRSLLTAAVLMADFPADVAGRYWRMYFYGLWPLAPAARGQGIRFAAKKWLLKSVHFGWFSTVALGLAVRGVAGRPRREIPWSAYTKHAKPTASSVPLSPTIPGGERA